MATAEVTKKVLVPAVEEVSEKRIVLDLTENEAKAVYVLVGAVASARCGNLDTGDIYEALNHVFGGKYSSQFAKIDYCKRGAGVWQELSGALKLVPSGR